MLEGLELVDLYHLAFSIIAITHRTRIFILLSNYPLVCCFFYFACCLATIAFWICVAVNMAKVEAEGLEKAFKLRKSIGTMNMTLFFDTQMKVQRYATELDIVREFGQLRLQYYEVQNLVSSFLTSCLQRVCAQ